MRQQPLAGFELKLQSQLEMGQFCSDSATGNVDIDLLRRCCDFFEPRRNRQLPNGFSIGIVNGLLDEPEGFRIEA